VLTAGEALDTTALSSLRGHLVCPLHSLNINSPYCFFSHKPYTGPLAAHKIVYELAQNKSPIQRFFTNQRFAQSITSLPNPVSYSSSPPPPAIPRSPRPQRPHRRTLSGRYPTRQQKDSRLPIRNHPAPHWGKSRCIRPEHRLCRQ